jgi:hypothetical protein
VRSQAVEALSLANRQRVEIAEPKRRIRCREITLVDLLEDPPGCIAEYGLIDVVRLGYQSGGRYKATPAITTLGRDAVRDGVNLLWPIGKASLRSRRWVAVHVVWCHARGVGHRAMTVDRPDVAA